MLTVIRGLMMFLSSIIILGLNSILFGCLSAETCALTVMCVVCSAIAIAILGMVHAHIERERGIVRRTLRALGF